MQNDIELGNRVQCQITGFKGIATARLEYLNGAVEYQVTPELLKDGSEYPKSVYLGSERLDVIDKGMNFKQHQKVKGFGFAINNPAGHA